MAAGVDADFAGNPWVFTYNGSSAAHTLPYLVTAVNPTTKMCMPIMYKRARWVSATPGATDKIIVKDYPGIPAGTTDQRTVIEFTSDSTTADTAVDEMRPRAHELFVGMQITQFDSGILFIYF